MSVTNPMPRSSFVAAWLADRFADHPTWPCRELDMAARSEGIALDIWWHSPAVLALGIRKDNVEVYPGAFMICWTVEPEGGANEP